MESTTSLLFVYGTLMQAIDSKVARYLRQDSNFIGSGNMSGYLYDLGSYPAAIHDANTKQKVFGHIFELKMPQSTLQILDEYEGIGVSEEYARKQVTIEFKKQTLNCWSYLYQLPTKDLHHIKSGNYLNYLSDPNSRHWKFIRSV